ncbi:MAG: restriction endonuclease subunit S [Dysgonomonas sp.]
MEATATKATFQKYSAYKDSGVEWLGKIPEHWEIGKLGTLLKPVSIKNRPDLPLLSITREAGVIERNIEDDSENHNFIPDDLSGYKVLNEGQFGMNKMKAWQGSYGIAPMTGIVSPAYYVFDFNSSINPRFFHLAIRSKNYVAFFGQASDGVRVGQWDLSKTRMKEIPFFIPSLPEQTAIAAFLDDKTAKIDRAIAQKEKMIALLKERKQIIIQNAVTKGLDPNAKMKHSGVEWIGEIPEGWEVKRLKFLGNIYSGISGKSGEDFSKENNGSMKPFVPFTNICNNLKIDVDQYQYVRISESENQNRVKKCDLLFLMSSETLEDIAKNSIYLGDDQELYLNSFCKGFRLHSDRALPEYVNYLLYSKPYRDYFSLVGRGFTRINLKQEYINDVYTILPPIEEQTAIVSFIEAQYTKVDKAIKLQGHQIEKLKELKSTLIDSAVTGKIKVS